MDEEKKGADYKAARKAMGNVRKVQAVFLGIFTLGLSMMAGDITEFVKSPFSTLSVTTTLFGMMGAIVCEFMARKAMSW